jgi:hypothetical protein
MQSAADDEFGFLPRGGTAMQVPTVTDSNEIEEKERQIDGNAFCFLPLPISTGLPCHRIKLHNLPECMKYLSFSIWAKTKDCFSFVLSF